MVDIATRVYNHTWKIDPIIRSVIDTDFYKLLMAQTIFRRHRDVQVTFGIHNRTRRVRLGDIIDEGELREQLDHVRTLRLTRGESTWLRGNTFYGKRQMFSPEFMDWLEDFRFPEYLLEREDGQYVLTFHGPWVETTMWEIPALAILNELRSRGVLKGMGKFELQVLYARAMTRVWEKIQWLKPLPILSIADFGTRRRHSFLWQDWCVQAMIEGLGRSFLGTSNCLIALRQEVEAIGTNAHELPMVYAALADTDAELAEAPYRVLRDWQEDYDGNLRVILPDTFIALDHMLRRFTRIVKGMVVYPERMRDNLERSGGVVFSGTVLLELARRGVSREQAYEWVQRNAMRAFHEKRMFKSLLLDDPDVTRILAPADIERAFDLDDQFKHIDHIFNRVFQDQEVAV